MNNNFEVFDIIGPIMIGPSSSHTAGAVRIGLVAGQFCDYKPIEIEVLFHGSLAKTYNFHKTDVAVIAGIIGMGVGDEQIKDSIQIAKMRGIKVEFRKVALKDAHPSTIIIKLLDSKQNLHVISAASIGGGNISIKEINGYEVDLDGKSNYLIGETIFDKLKLEEIVVDIFNGNASIENFQKNKFINSFKINIDKLEDNAWLEEIKQIKAIRKVFFVKAVMPVISRGKNFFNNCEELVRRSKENNDLISETVIKYEIEKSKRTKDQVVQQMKESYLAMEASIRKGIYGKSQLLGNIFGGNAIKMDKFIKSGSSVCGVTLSKVVRNALAVMEVNGSMGKIVACPTAGSAGIVPAAVFTVAEEHNIPESKIIQSLFTGGGIGIIIAKNATISGSVGGCQAECGSASAIAAAIISEMLGGNYEQILSSVSLALGNMLGIVCDPVAGMVEIPCIQRNAMSAANAIISAEMALAGIDSVIPADEIIYALDEVGKLMDSSLKDTLRAGISNTPTAKRIQEKAVKD